MAIDLALDRKTSAKGALEMPTISAGNDNALEEQQKTVTELNSLELSPLTHRAAWSLVEHHQKGHKVEIKSRGHIEHVFEDLTEQFMSFGTTRIIASNLAQALVDDTVQRAEEFSGKVGQKYIGVSAFVAETFNKSMYQFETGHTELIVIGKNTADIAGSSGIEVRFTATGTATTSNRADVGQIFASVKKWGLYIVQEAPGKQELKGIEAEAQIAMAALGAEMGAEGASMDAGGLQAILEQLEELGLLTPEIQEMMQNLAELQELAAQESTPETEAAIKELSDQLTEDLSAAVEDGSIPLPLLEGAVEFIQTLSDTNSLGNVIDMSSLMDLKQDIHVAQIITKLETISETLDGDEKAELDALIEELADMDGAEIIEQLDVIKEHLETLDLPAETMDALFADMDVLKSEIIQNLPLNEKIEFLSALAAEDVMELLQGLDGVENIPEELAEKLADLLETIDIESLSLDELKEALAGNGDPEIAKAVQQILLTLNDPEVQAVLPPALAELTVQTLGDHAGLVEAIATQAVVTELQGALAEMDASSPEAAHIEQVIAKIEAGQPISEADSTILAQVVETLGNDAPPQLVEAAATIAEATTTTVEAANTNIEPKISELSNDTVTFLTSLEQHSETISPEAKQAITTLLQNPQDLDALKEVRATLGDNTPPEIKTSIAVATLVQHGKTPVTIPPNMTVQAVVQSLNIIADKAKTEGNTVQAEHLKSSAKIIEKLTDPQNPPTVQEVVATVQKLNSAIAKETNPEIKQQLQKTADHIVTTIPSAVINDLKSVTNQQFAANNNTPNISTGIIGLDTTDLENISTVFEGCAGGCDGCHGCDTKTEQTVKDENNSGDSYNTDRPADRDANQPDAFQNPTSNPDTYSNDSAQQAQPSALNTPINVAANTNNVITFDGGGGQLNSQELFKGIIGLEDTDLEDISTVFEGCASGCDGCTGCDVPQPEQKKQASSPAP